MSELETDRQVSKNYFYKRKVVVYQHKKGYRFSVDAPILAEFLPVTNGKACEIGMGSGIISLLAMYKKKFSYIYGFEIQAPLAKLARLNIKKNGFEDKIKVVSGDFCKHYVECSKIQTVFSNPPYLQLNRGRLSPNREIRAAKTEVSLTLSDLLEGVFKILAEGGNLYMILPCQRLQELKLLAQKIGFFIAKLRIVSSFRGGKGERFLIQLTNISVSLLELPPLIIFKNNGIYTDEMDKIFIG